MIDFYPIPTECPYCGSSVILTSNTTIYGKPYGNGKCYKCTGCDAYVGVHTGTNIPLGRLANKELRELKKECHALFDKAWRDNKTLNRRSAYKCLAKMLEIPVGKCHFGWFDKVLLCEAKKILSQKYWYKNKTRVEVKR